MKQFNYLTSKTSRKASPLDRDAYLSLIESANVNLHCDSARAAHDAGNTDEYAAQKGQLPLILWLGFNADGERKAESQTPTGYFFIDIDHHLESTKMIAFKIHERAIEINNDLNGSTFEEAMHHFGIRLIHETPSGGTRIVIKRTPRVSIEDDIKQYTEQFGFSRFGDVDGCVKDLSRGSFVVKKSWHHYIDDALWDEEIDIEGFVETDSAMFTPSECSAKSTSSKVPEITEEMKQITYNGVKVSELAQKYINSKGGVPPQGQRHAFYNDLVKKFRNLCDNNPQIVFAVLPLCDGTPADRWRQCSSICKSNNTSMLPKDFYYWLVNNGIIETKKQKQARQELESESEDEESKTTVTFPPVFREFCSVCPEEFVYPTVVALLPIMGTLTSYVRAEYIDNSEQSTTFFSTIWAPPGSRKSFAGNLVDILMSKIMVRDEINNIRERLWLIEKNTKSDNKDKPDMPHVMVRQMPAIFSQPEFLEKMRDNRGFHMFTFAEEVDTFRKGSKAGGGGDKSDLFRCAWDNSRYGQSYKSAATFKGMVKLYYNILLTGTPGAVNNYYSNVEDGMVTRISICEIENQQYASFKPWKKLSKRQMEIIDKFVERCDYNTYQEPCPIGVDEANSYNDAKKFDAEVTWKFKLKDFQKINMSWIFPTLLKWLEQKRQDASLAENQAMDVFRRRTAVKGFRLALLCTCCWSKINKREQDVIKNFVLWFMNRDLGESLKMFGDKYNEMVANETVRSCHHKSLYNNLSKKFTKADLVKECISSGVKSRARQILFRWIKDGAIKKIENDSYIKII